MKRKRGKKRALGNVRWSYHSNNWPWWCHPFLIVTIGVIFDRQRNFCQMCPFRYWRDNLKHERGGRGSRTATLILMAEGDGASLLTRADTENGERGRRWEGVGEDGEELFLRAIVFFSCRCHFYFEASKDFYGGRCDARNLNELEMRLC